MIVKKYAPSELLTLKTPQELGLQYTSLQRLEVSGNHLIKISADESEIALVVLEGKIQYHVTLLDCSHREGDLSVRDILFLPPHSRVILSGAGVAMRFQAPSELGASFTHLSFHEIDQDPSKHKTYGNSHLGTYRHVWHAVGDDFPCSRLMLGFCQGSPGGWTAWPPHEHGREREEVYVYFGMGKGFGIQLVYEDLSQPGISMVVHEGDAVSIPGGFHPNVGCPLNGIQYVYCMTAKEPGKREFLNLRIQKEYGEKFV